jgi:hypothetical protein
VYKVQQFYQKNFKAPDDGYVGRNILEKIGQVQLKKLRV